jgi:predicted DNA-binding transcriptional regulator YafY
MFGRANYLVAAELGKPKPMNWRLDRLRDMRVLDLHAAAPADFSLRDYANRSFGIFQAEIEDVVLRILPAGANEAMGWRFHPTQTTQSQPDGSVIVTFQASGMQELAWHLFTWGDQVQILAPSSLKALMVKELERALEAHRGADERPVSPERQQGL